MMKRMVATLATGMLLSGSAFAQTPAYQPSSVATPTMHSSAAVPVSTSDGPWSSAPEMTTSSGAGFWSPTPGANSADNYWINANYMIGWFRGTNTPPLVTTSPSGTAQSVAGTFQSPTTTVLFGNGEVNGTERSGFELGGGGWFDAEHRLGFEASASILASKASIFGASSDGSTILARPYTDSTTGNPASVLIAFPGTGTAAGAGSISARIESGNYYEGHIDLTTNVWNAGWWHVDGLLGYRYYNYSEGLSISTVQKPSNANFVSGTQINSADNFNTYNNFNGGDFGLRTGFDFGSFNVDFLTKIAVGGTSRESKILGSQTIDVPGQAPLTQVGGVYALSSNIGTYKKYDFSVMPEFGTDISWHFMPNWKATFGYSVLELGRVARATDQVDTTVNPNLFAPAVAGADTSHPAFPNGRNDVWIQTLKLGLEWTF